MSVNIEKQIKSLNQLLRLLEDASLDEMGKLLKQTHIEVKDLEAFCNWNDECYTRTCILKSERMEVLLLSWGAGQETEIHNHGGQKCWVHQLMGSVTEIKYNIDRYGIPHESKQLTLNEGECSYIDDKMGVHSLHNFSNRKSVSLHLYIKPIDTCTIYKKSEDNFLKEMSYDYLNLIPCEQ